MSRKIIGVTVGTPISSRKIESDLKPVKTVNGRAPDENGNVEVEGAGGGAGGGGVKFEVGVGLKLKDGVLSVDSATDFNGDNSRPAEAALVHTLVGNVEIILKTI